MTFRASLLLCLAFPAVAAAQQTLAEQIADAVRPRDWDEQFRKLGLREQPIGAIVDALASLRGRLADPQWPIAFSLVTQREHEVEALWRDEPDRRRARAAIFAHALQNWAWRYRRAKDAERADIQEVARFLDPLRHYPKQGGPRAEHESQLAAEIVLQRITVATILAAPNPFAEQLRSDEGDWSSLLRVRTIQDGACSPFHLIAVLGDPEPRIRARAAAVLRLMLGLDLPPWLVDLLERDPAPAAKRFAAQWIRRGGPLTDAQVDQVVELLAKNDPTRSLPPIDNVTGLGAAARSRLASAMISKGLRIPADPETGTRAEDGQGGPGRGEGRDGIGSRNAAWWFGRAAALGPTQYQRVLVLAASVGKADVARRIVDGLVEYSEMPHTDLPGARAAFLALLDHPAADVVAGAGTLAARWLAMHDEPAVRSSLGDLALTALGKEATTVAFGRWTGPDSCNGIALYGPPATPGATLVHAAAEAGDARLVAPLLAELQRLPASPDTSHRWFVLECLGALAPLTDGDQARALRELLGTRPKKRLPIEDRTDQLERTILFGLYPSVPADLLPSYLPLQADEFQARRFVSCLDRAADHVSEERAKMLLTTADGRYFEASLLWLRVPDLLVARWRAGGEDRERAVRTLGSVWRSHPERIVALVAAGQLPREFAAASLPEVGMPLSQFVQVLPRGEVEAAAWSGRFAKAIESATADAVDADVTALRTLASAEVAEVARAAAHRAAKLGAVGQEIARDTFARLSVDPDANASAAALELAVEDGIEFPALADVVARLRRSGNWFSRMVADAAALRFLGADPGRFPSKCPADALVLAGVDVDTATLRKVFGDDVWYQLQILLQGATATTLVSGLEIAQGLPWWGQAIEKSVMSCTSHADPRVRRAAYEALRSRDAGVWACALLVHEASLDPDATVRECARSPSR